MMSRLISFTVEFFGSKLGRALLTLPFVVLGNSLFGAVLAGLKERYDSSRLKAGLFKGAVVFAGIFMFALVSYFNNDLIIDFNGDTYSLVDAMFVIIWAAVLAYGTDGITKLAKIFKFKVGNITEVDVNE